MRTTIDDDAVPVLNAVVESGNESIIQSSRLGREVILELEKLQQVEPVKFVLQEHLLKNANNAEYPEAKESQADLSLSVDEAKKTSSTHSEDEIELMIDEVVDRHIHALREDIRLLLGRVKHKT